jgi:hypothetical protein
MADKRIKEIVARSDERIKELVDANTNIVRLTVTRLTTTYSKPVELWADCDPDGGVILNVSPVYGGKSITMQLTPEQWQELISIHT